MTELEADDALASAAEISSRDPRVDQVLICTPDKDLAQAVVGRARSPARPTQRCHQRRGCGP